jgi:hypothetical protein
MTETLPVAKISHDALSSPLSYFRAHLQHSLVYSHPPFSSAAAASICKELPFTLGSVPAVVRQEAAATT